jgi:hypothetical protein
MQSLRIVYAWFTHGLHMVYAWFCAEFTQMFMQGLRRVYAGLRSSGTCCVLRKPRMGFYRFTHGLRRFTHILRKPEYVYAEFTQVYAGYAGLRRGQLADGLDPQRLSGRDCSPSERVVPLSCAPEQSAPAQPPFMDAAQALRALESTAALRQS